MKAAFKAASLAIVMAGSPALSCEVPGSLVLPYLISIGGSINLATGAGLEDNCAVVSASIVATAPASRGLTCSFKLFSNITLTDHSGVDSVMIKGEGFTTTRLPHPDASHFIISGVLKAAADKTAIFTIDSIKGSSAFCDAWKSVFSLEPSSPPPTPLPSAAPDTN